MNWIYFGLALSIVLNVFLVLYLRALLSKFTTYSEGISDLQYNLNGYESHLKAIYSMDTFFGEPILQNLLEHTKIINSSVKEYVEIFLIDDEQIDEAFKWSDQLSEEETEEEVAEETEAA